MCRLRQLYLQCVAPASRRPAQCKRTFSCCETGMLSCTTAQRALKHVQKHIRRLSAEQPDVQWGFFITGQHTCCVMGMSPLPVRRSTLSGNKKCMCMVALTSPPLGFHTYPPGHALIVQSRRRGYHQDSEDETIDQALRQDPLLLCRAGHSLGGFAAATCLILCDRILTCTAFESPWPDNLLPQAGRPAGRRGLLARAHHQLPGHPQPHQHVPEAPRAHHQVACLCLQPPAKSLYAAKHFMPGKG